MAKTLLAMVQDISRDVGLDPYVTSFSDDDDTRRLVKYIYEAYQRLQRETRPDSLSFRESNIINLINGTRAYVLPSDSTVYGVWNVRDDEQCLLQGYSEEQIADIASDYKTTSGKPTHYYFTDISTIAFYPVPDNAYTYTHFYESEITEDYTPTVSLALPNDWIKFIEKYAQYLFEKNRGFGGVEGTYMEAEDLLHNIRVQMWRINRTGFKVKRHYYG